MVNVCKLLRNLCLQLQSISFHNLGISDTLHVQAAYYHLLDNATDGQTDGRTDGRTDDIIMTIVDHTTCSNQHDRLKKERKASDYN